MKNIFKYLALATVTLGAVACVKAEYKTSQYVSFNAAKVNIPEACGIYRIPVCVHNAKEAVVTYKVTEGKAKKGEDFVIVDKYGNIDESGVLSIADGSDTIYVKITDKTGILTKNLNFDINILASATEGIVLGSTTALACTILDADAGINLLAGSWSGTGLDTKGADANLNFSIEILDPESEDGKYFTKIHPDCNLIFDDLTLKSGGNTMDNNDGPVILGYYDDNTGQVHIYSAQPFNAYNFGDPVGVAFVGFGVDYGSYTKDVTFSMGDDTLVLDSDIKIFLFEYDEEWDYDVTAVFNGYSAGGFVSGLEMKKLD